MAFESAFGWPLFQTASNAMIADLLPPDRRRTGFGVSRVAMNLGVVVGPVAAGQALRLGVSYRSLFLAAAAGCVLMVVMMAIWIRESRPAGAAQRAARHVDHQGRSGYRIVFHDKVFLVFCLVAVLPVFCIGNFGSIYAVYITDYLGVPSASGRTCWPSTRCIVVAVQYPAGERAAAPQPHAPAGGLECAPGGGHRRLGVRRAAVVAGAPSSPC